MAYGFAVRLSNSPCIEAWARQLSMRSTVPKANKRLRDTPCSHCCESHKRTKLHNCVIHTEGLGESHTGSLAVDSVSMNPNESMLVNAVGFLVVFLTPLGPKILSLSLLQDSPRST